jgi:hypothetical protein
MTTTKKATLKKNPTTDVQIISTYMEQVLLNNAEPKNIYLFCKILI